MALFDELSNFIIARDRFLLAKSAWAILPTAIICLYSKYSVLHTVRQRTSWVNRVLMDLAQTVGSHT